MILLGVAFGCKDREAEQKVAELQAQLGALQKKQQADEAAAKAAQVARDVVPAPKAIQPAKEPPSSESGRISDKELADLIRGTDEHDFVGTWSLSYKADYTTCENIDRGDQLTATLLVSLVKGQFSASETKAGDATPVQYTGTLYGDMVLFTASGPNDSKLTIELRKKGKGRRVINNPGCVIIYDVAGKLRR